MTLRRQRDGGPGRRGGVEPGDVEAGSPAASRRALDRRSRPPRSWPGSGSPARGSPNPCRMPPAGRCRSRCSSDRGRPWPASRPAPGRSRPPATRRPPAQPALEDDDPAHAGRRGEDRCPAPDRARPDDHQIRPIRHARLRPFRSQDRRRQRRPTASRPATRPGDQPSSAAASTQTATTPRRARRSNVGRRRTVHAATSRPAARATAIERCVDGSPLDGDAAAAELDRRRRSSTAIERHGC